MFATSHGRGRFYRLESGKRPFIEAMSGMGRAREKPPRESLVPEVNANNYYIPSESII